MENMKVKREKQEIIFFFLKKVFSKTLVPLNIWIKYGSLVKSFGNTMYCMSFLDIKMVNYHRKPLESYSIPKIGLTSFYQEFLNLNRI